MQIVCKPISQPWNAVGHVLPWLHVVAAMLSKLSLQSCVTGTQFTAFILNLKLLPLPAWNDEKSCIWSWNDMQSRMVVRCGHPPKFSDCMPTQTSPQCLFPTANHMDLSPKWGIPYRKVPWPMVDHGWKDSQPSNTWDLVENNHGTWSRRKCSAILDAKVIKTSEA